ncbi:PREDICTED: chymotrypsin-1-like [Wasmannia auropunctata]|uniref:chymotrypsin-1-like n=1 Tax=Wasmannia auropunctata TaxID=64793 RepID=UPI0005EE7B96|nr:PREDICTED: chymotrypsin-1-like [Wasmannia auropunctata]
MSRVPSPHIKGGKNAPIGKFPYQVSLRLNKSHICSGSILDNLNVLTSAHCIVGKGVQWNEDLKVHVGTNLLDTPGYVHDVTSITVHQNYDINLYSNDIALIHLKYPIRYNKLVQPVKLPTSDEDFLGQLCTLSGWGYGESDFNSILQEIESLVCLQSECKEKYWYFIESHICGLLPRNTSTCNDFGSPLVVNGVQIGIVPEINSCFQDPFVFTRVSSFLPWITANLEI